MHKITIPLAVFAAMFLWITPAVANLVVVYSVDDPSQDPLNVNGVYHEIGDGFLQDELLISSWSLTDLRPCPENPDDPEILNVAVNITNLTGSSLDDVYYVADLGTSLQNYDGSIGNVALKDAQLSFRIDWLGINKPLIFESMIPDNIWQAGELWTFVIQDFIGVGGGPPAPFGSPGIASVSVNLTNSTGSIIAIPEPSTLVLAAMGLFGFGIYFWRRR
ncbi:MAG TPA: PEP-CTERM sorting domain-containing protein [Thermoguttaceae bacterium]